MKGRKRHLVVETRGVLMTMVLTSAGFEDGVAALTVLGQVHPHDGPRLVTVVADQQLHHHDLAAGMAAQRGGWRSEVNMRAAGTKGVTPLEKRWVMERTNAWQGRYRRHRKDAERSGESRTAMIQMSNSHLMLNRLAPCGRPELHDRKEAA